MQKREEARKRLRNKNVIAQRAEKKLKMCHVVEDSSVERALGIKSQRTRQKT